MNVVEYIPYINLDLVSTSPKIGNNVRIGSSDFMKQMALFMTFANHLAL